MARRLLAFFALVLMAALLVGAQDPIFMCPMDPEVRSSVPGNMPAMRDETGARHTESS